MVYSDYCHFCLAIVSTLNINMTQIDSTKYYSCPNTIRYNIPRKVLIQMVIFPTADH